MRKVSAIDIAPTEARKAAKHIQRIHGTTPILPLEYLERDGILINLFGKFENVQSMYTFKARGAEWFVYRLMSDLIAKGIATPDGRFENEAYKPVLVTASAGNHAQGVALAAERYRLEAVIFMPETTPAVKRERVEKLHATIRLVGNFFDEALEEAKKFKSESRSRIFVPPYENPFIMAGQASIGVEILSQWCRLHPDYLRVAEYNWQVPDVIITPLGGGGLVSGIGAVVQEFNRESGKRIRVIGVQTEKADSMYQSVKAGEYRPSSDMEAKSVADGIAVKKASPRMIETVKRYVDQVVVVGEDDIKKGIAYLHQHPKLKDQVWKTHEEENPAVPFRNYRTVYRERPLSKVEGAAAAPYAAVLFGDLYGEIDWREIAGDRKELNVICVLTGANIANEKHDEITGSYLRPPDIVIYSE